MDPTPAQRWLRDRTFHHSRFDAASLAGARSQSISVCLPARECAATVGRTVEELAVLRDEGVIDELVVVDAASSDGTAAVAAAAGATVVQEADLLPEFGPVLGKGDALWRAPSVPEGEPRSFPRPAPAHLHRPSPLPGPRPPLHPPSAPF